MINENIPTLTEPKYQKVTKRYQNAVGQVERPVGYHVEYAIAASQPSEVIVPQLFRVPRALFFEPRQRTYAGSKATVPRESGLSM